MELLNEPVVITLSPLTTILCIVIGEFLAGVTQAAYADWRMRARARRTLLRVHNIAAEIKAAAAAEHTAQKKPDASP